jgi:hypothetical protein
MRNPSPAQPAKRSGAVNGQPDRAERSEPRSGALDSNREAQLPHPPNPFQRFNVRASTPTRQTTTTPPSDVPRPLITIHHDAAITILNLRQQSVPITHDHMRRPFVWLTTDEADLRRTNVTRGECHAPIRSRRRVLGRRRPTRAKPVRPAGRQGLSESARRQPETNRTRGTPPSARPRTMTVTLDFADFWSEPL